MTLLLKYSDFSSFNHISSLNGLFTSLIWYDDFYSGNLSGFRIFSRFPRIFSNSQIFMILLIFSENWWYTFQIWFVLLKIHPVSWFFFNSHISAVFFIYFQRIDDRLFKYDMFYGKFTRFLYFFKFSDIYNSFHAICFTGIYLFSNFFRISKIFFSFFE